MADLRRILGTAILAAGLLLPVSAQQGRFGRGPGAAAPRRERREVARLYVVQRMREALSLSDAQTLKVMDALKALDEARTAHREALRPLLDGVRAHLDDPSTPDDVLIADVKSIQAEQARLEQALKTEEERLLLALTPRQRARFLLLRRELLEEIVSRGAEPGPPPAGPRSP